MSYEDLIFIMLKYHILLLEHVIILKLLGHAGCAIMGQIGSGLAWGQTSVPSLYLNLWTFCVGNIKNTMLRQNSCSPDLFKSVIQEGLSLFVEATNSQAIASLALRFVYWLKLQYTRRNRKLRGTSCISNNRGGKRKLQLTHCHSVSARVLLAVLLVVLKTYF